MNKPFVNEDEGDTLLRLVVAALILLPTCPRPASGGRVGISHYWR
ncbi:MAG: hypothetical protein U0528_09605 [Anaerolineae bacterium]